MSNFEYYFALAQRAEKAAEEALTVVARRSWQSMAEQYRAQAERLKAQSPKTDPSASP